MAKSPSRQRRHTAVIVDGVQVTYLERAAAGPTDKAPLLLLHGLVASADTFGALVKELPTDRRVISLNLPGLPAPNSTAPPDVTLYGLAKLLRDFCVAVEMHRPIILGHSHGGAVAIQMGASFADDISGLILLCPAHPFLYQERWLVAFYNSWFGGLIARSFRFAPTFVQSAGFLRLLGPVGRKADINVRPYRKALRHTPSVLEVLRLLKTWNDDMDALGVALLARPVTLPTVFLWGDHDKIVPLATEGALRRGFVGSELVVLRGVGHLPNDEDPGECGRVIRMWLEGR